MSRKYDSKLDSPGKPKPKTSTTDEQNGTGPMPLGNSVNIPTQPQNTAQPLDQAVPDDVINYIGSFLNTKDLAATTRASQNLYQIFRKDEEGELRKRAVQQLLQYIVAPKRKDAPAAVEKAEAMIKNNLDLLLDQGEVETYARDLKGNPVIVKGTAFQLALAAEDEEMARMIATYLDEHYPYVDENNPGEKQKQYRAQFPSEAEEEKAEEFKNTSDGKALNTIISAIANASVRACELVVNHEENIPADDKEAQELLTVINVFRDHVTPKGVIKTGKHFNMPLLIEAFKLYDQNHNTVAFGSLNSDKNKLCWRKLIGFLQRFLPACYAQAFAQGIRYIVEGGGKLRRSFYSNYGDDSYFPLDSDLNFRLGYNYANGGWLPPPSGDPRVVGAWHYIEKLYQAKTAALQRIMQQSCAPSKSKCLVM